jgi:hypothetical protein
VPEGGVRVGYGAWSSFFEEGFYVFGFELEVVGGRGGGVLVEGEG